MARKSETLELVIRAKDAGSKEVKKVDKAFKQLRGRIKSLPKALFNLKVAFAGVAGALVVRDFLKTADAFERYRTQLVTITGSAQKAEEAMKWITRFTATTPYELDQVTASFAKLSAYGLDATQHMGVLGDTAAAMGKGLDQSVEMFADAITGEFERLKEFGIRASQEGDAVTLKWIQNGQQMVKVSEKTQKGISGALSEILSGRFEGAMERYSATYAGMMSNLSDQFTLFQKQVMEAGVFDYIKTALSVVLERINELRKSGDLSKWAEKTASSVISAFERIMLGTATFYDAIAPVVENIKKLLASVWDTFKSMPTWAQEVGLVVAILGGKKVAAAMVGLMHLYDAAKNIGGAVKAIAEGRLSWKEFAQMNYEELDVFLKNIEGKTEAGGQIVRQKIHKPIKDFWGEFNQADSATKKMQILLGYMRQLKTEQKETADESDKASLPGDAKAPPVSQPAQDKARIARLTASTKTALAILEDTYEKGEIAFKQYFDRRAELMEKQFETELALLQKQAGAETDPGKRLAVETQIFQKEQELERARIGLASERHEKENELAEKRVELDRLMGDMRLRAEMDTKSGLDAIFASELAEMDARHAEELDRLRTLNASKEQIEDAYRMQKTEKEKALAGQTTRVWEAQAENMATLAGGMSDMFTEMYELSGEKTKEFFYLAKAAAIAEAVMNQAKAITGALGTPPYGVGAIVNAALVGAQAAVQIAKISAQSFAAGGSVPGVSPSDTADNVPIMATAGEWVQPVKTVQHYGAKVMEAMRRRLIPRELFSGLALSLPSSPRASSAFAGGGEVPSTPAAQPNETTIINITDPREIDRYMSSAEGQNAVINLISSRAGTIKRLLR